MAERHFRAALFDMDGTLQDSEIHWIYATRDFLNSRGANVDDDEATKIVYGRSALEIYSDVIDMLPGQGLAWEGVAEEVRRLYMKRMDECDIAYPESVALLKELAKKMPVGVVSGSPIDDVILSLKKLGVFDDLSVVLGAEDVRHGKPSPEGFSKAADLLGIEREDCIVFEDSTAGVLSAKASGMYCVAISRPDRPKQDVSMADEIVSDLGEFHY